MPINPDIFYNTYVGGHIVFIIGSELLQMKDPARKNGEVTDQPSYTFEQHVINSLHKDHRDNGVPPQNYSELVTLNSSVNKGVVEGLYKTAQKNNLFNTDLLKMIAELANLVENSVIISTSYDNTIETFLQNSDEPAIWNLKKNPIFLNITTKKTKIIHLFGMLGSAGEIALSEDEQVDYLISLASSSEMNKSNNFERYSFLEYIKDKTLVFIGNNFPDSFMRLLIRSLYNSTITNMPNKAYIINDQRGNASFRRYFFDKYNIQLFHDSPIKTVLEELYSHITQKDKFENPYPGYRIFICYDREDEQCADKLRKELERRHINSFMDVYDLGIEEHKIKIKDTIQSSETCVCICIISNTLMSKEKSDSYVLALEWGWIARKYNFTKFSEEMNQVCPPFHVIPVATDSFDTYKTKLPDFIIDNNIHHCDETVCGKIEALIQNLSS